MLLLLLLLFMTARDMAPQQLLLLLSLCLLIPKIHCSGGQSGQDDASHLKRDLIIIIQRNRLWLSLYFSFLQLWVCDSRITSLVLMLPYSTSSQSDDTFNCPFFICSSSPTCAHRQSFSHYYSFHFHLSCTYPESVLKIIPNIACSFHLISSGASHRLPFRSLVFTQPMNSWHRRHLR